MVDIHPGRPRDRLCCADSVGDEDLAIANLNGGILPIRTGAFGAAFAAAPDVAAGNNDAVAIGDFNGDGDEDLAIIDVARNKVRIRTGNGAGATFGTAAD